MMCSKVCVLICLLGLAVFVKYGEARRPSGLSISGYKRNVFSFIEAIFGNSAESSESAETSYESVYSPEKSPEILGASIVALGSLFQKLPARKAGSLIAAVPSAVLGPHIKSLPTVELTNVLRDIPHAGVQKVLSSVPSNDLRNILGRLPIDQLKKILQSKRSLGSVPDNRLAEYGARLGSGLIYLAKFFPASQDGHLLAQLPTSDAGNFVKGLSPGNTGKFAGEISKDKLASIIGNAEEGLPSVAPAALPSVEPAALPSVAPAVAPAAGNVGGNVGRNPNPIAPAITVYDNYGRGNNGLIGRIVHGLLGALHL